MASLNNFSIPVKGLKDGMHLFEFELDDMFFPEFEGSPIQDGQLTAKVGFDKRPDMFVLDVAIEGTIQTECDRCVEDIAFPVEGQHQQIIKLSDHSAETIDEVVYLPVDTAEINIARFIYEFVVLSIPMVKTCDAVPGKSCYEEVLRKLDGDRSAEQAGNNPIWAALNKLKDN